MAKIRRLTMLRELLARVFAGEQKLVRAIAQGCGINDDLLLEAGYRMSNRGGLGLHGKLTIRGPGNLVTVGYNKVVYAGIEAIVDKLVAAGNINAWQYIGFGTATDATEDTDTTLGTEITGGSYARLDADQTEGDNAREYRVGPNAWTNNSGAQRVVTEYGLFTASTNGTMLCRVSTGDGGGPTSRTVEVSDTITPTWDIQLADA